MHYHSADTGSMSVSEEKTKGVDVSDMVGTGRNITRAGRFRDRYGYGGEGVRGGGIVEGLKGRGKRQHIEGGGG